MEGEARTVLKIEGVTKTFAGVRALDCVSFEAKAGEVHGLVGENGAGKSTLMGVGSGTLVPDAGTVTIDGTCVSGDPKTARELGLAIVRQEPSLMADLSVAENLFLALPSGKRPRIAEMTDWAKQLLGPWDRMDVLRPGDLVSTLNPEQRFMVEIAKALAAGPKVLILDEPTEYLRAEDVERLFEKVKEAAKAGQAVVYISHRIREVRRIAQRVTVLRDGKWQGTFSVDSLNERQIVELIVGGGLDHEYPPKAAAVDDRPVVLETRGLSGEGFNGVTIEVRRGEILGLAGIQANGQREFLRALAGIDRSEGHVAIKGKRFRLRGPDSAWRNEIGYLPGDRHRDGIFLQLSVKENYAIRSLWRDAQFGIVGVSNEALRARHAVASFAVRTPSIDTPASSLSGGNQQKLILASVLAAEPAVLLIDEPTHGVDVGGRAEIYRILREIAANGTAIIVVSSHSEEIAGLCDRVAVFSRGEIATQLSGDEVTEINITTSVLSSSGVRVGLRRQTAVFWRWAAGNSAPVALLGVAIVALGIYASAVSEFYLTGRNLGGVLALVSPLALVAYGQQIILLLGEIDLSVGPTMGLCVVVGSFFFTSGAGPVSGVLGLLLMFAAAATIGSINFVLVDRLVNHPMIATLATYMCVQAISLVLRPSPGGLIDPQLMKLISTRIGFVPVTLIVAAAVGLVLQYLLFRTTLGISLRGLGSDPEAARLAGVKSRLVRFCSYVSCAIFAAVAAIPLSSQIGIGDAKAGLNYTLSSIAAVVIGGGTLSGGRGSFIGTLLGGILINQINIVSTFLQFSDAWSFYLQGGIVLLGVALYSRSRQTAVARY